MLFEEIPVFCCYFGARLIVNYVKSARRPQMYRNRACTEMEIPPDLGNCSTRSIRAAAAPNTDVPQTVFTLEGFWRFVLAAG